LFSLAKLGHSTSQIIQRQQVLLIGGHQTINALLNARELAFQGVFPALRRTRIARCGQPPFQLLLNEFRTFQ
jgi:hypothetical protein